MIRPTAFLLIFGLGLVCTSLVGGSSANPAAAGRMAPVDVMVTYQGDRTHGGLPAVQCPDPCLQTPDPSRTADG